MILIFLCKLEWLTLMTNMIVSGETSLEVNVKEELVAVKGNVGPNVAIGENKIISSIKVVDN